MKAKSQEQLTDAQIAALCGRSRQAVAKWHSKGLPRRPTVTQVLRHLVRQHVMPSTTERLMAGKAEAAAHSRRKLEANLIERDWVIGFLRRLDEELTRLHLAAVERLVPQLVPVTDPAEIRRLIRASTHALRNELAAIVADDSFDADL